MGQGFRSATPSTKQKILNEQVATAQADSYTETAVNVVRSISREERRHYCSLSQDWIVERQPVRLIRKKERDLNDTQQELWKA